MYEVWKAILTRNVIRMLQRIPLKFTGNVKDSILDKVDKLGTCSLPLEFLFFVLVPKTISIIFHTGHVPNTAQYNVLKINNYEFKSLQMSGEGFVRMNKNVNDC